MIYIILELILGGMNLGFAVDFALQGNVFQCILFLIAANTGFILGIVMLSDLYL